MLNDIAIAIFVLDVVLVIVGWPTKPSLGRALATTASPTPRPIGDRAVRDNGSQWMAGRAYISLDESPRDVEKVRWLALPSRCPRRSRVGRWYRRTCPRARSESTRRASRDPGFAYAWSAP